CTSTSTSPGPATGGGTSSTTSDSGGPHALHNTAFMRSLPGDDGTGTRPVPVTSKRRSYGRGRLPRSGQNAKFTPLALAAETSTVALSCVVVPSVARTTYLPALAAPASAPPNGPTRAAPDGTDSR